MYRRDLIAAEIEKLAQVLAKILGFKIALRLQEAEDLFVGTLANSFDLSTDLLYAPAIAPFQQWLDETDLPAEKLDLLSQFIFNEIDLKNDKVNNPIFAKKLNLIYQALASKHHVIHLVHLDRQQMIKQYI